MTHHRKVAIVALGYVLALVASVAAGWVYDLQMSAMPYDTSGGMYAGGQLMLALGVFFVVALAPTLLALWFLRGNARVWQGIAVLSLTFASVGLLAVLLPLTGRGTQRTVPGMLLDLLGLAQLLGVPLWTGAFVLFSWLAPTRPARRLLAAAVGIELVIGICAAIHWFVPRSPI